MPKDLCEVELPKAGATQVMNLRAGEVNTLSFSKDSIMGDPRLNADGSVTMDLINGSHVVIENFQELANSADSCGRDTIIQLSDNTIIYPEDLYKQLVSSTETDSGEGDSLAALAPAAGDEGESFGVKILNAPIDESQELYVQAGQEYQFSFDLTDVQAMTQKGMDLIVDFGQGQTLTLRDFYVVANGALPPIVALADGSVIEAISLVPTFLASRNAEEDIATIEPASGEESPSEDALEVVESTISEDTSSENNSVENPSEEIDPQYVDSTSSIARTDLAEVAQQFSEIEPAAGETGTASRGGYGYQSGVDAAPLVNDPAIGPHEYTELNYNAPEFVDEQNVLVGSGDAPTPPPPPTISIPSLVVKEDSSVDVVVDVPNTGAGNILTVEIDVPVGWSVVDLNGGTYDAGTGIWTFTTPVGVDFLGGPEVAPPADSDIDSETLDVTVTVTDTTTGLTSSATDTYTILTDAVADTPDLTASNASGEEGTIVPLTITTDTTDGDGSEVISLVRISDVPVGVSLTAGTEVTPGVWELDVADLVGLGVNAPDGTVGTYTLTVESIADEAPVSDNEFDFTDNQASNTTEVTLTITADDVPDPQDETKTLDESDLGPLTVSGTVTVDFGTDGPGTITPKAANSFTVDGSLSGGVLSSHGSPVTVTLAGNAYTGTSADGRDIFTLQVNSDGSYSFNLLDELDHADGTNPNDVIDLHFSYQAADNDGDVVDGLITIRVADDAPVAVDDTNSLSDVETVTTGNVLTNDDSGEDAPVAVTEVTFNGVTVTVPVVGTVTVVGDHGVLELAADGSYTYTRTTEDAGQDVFTYTIVDFDGDPSKADLTITLVDADDIPEIGDGEQTVDETELGPLAVSGTVSADFGTDGPGTVAPTGAGSFLVTGSVAGGTLTSGGVPVTVTVSGDTYTGTAGTETIFTLVVDANGDFTFNLIGTLDHADTTNPDDVIDLVFGVTGTDDDGDTDTGAITIHVKDDGPYIEEKDFSRVEEYRLENGPIVITKTLDFDFGEDGEGSIAPNGSFMAKYEAGGTAQDLTSNGVLVDVVATADGYIGTAGGDTVFTIVIDPTSGEYTYTQFAAVDHPEGVAGDDVLWIRFGVTITDADGDTADSTIGFDIYDDEPYINTKFKAIDETNLDGVDQISYTQTLDFDFGEDGAGAIDPTGNFSALFQVGGQNQDLTSGGETITVTATADGYIGKTGGDTVFDLVVNPTTGQYTYTQYKPVDHPDGTNHDDVIWLKFEVQITDADGDTDTAIIGVDLHDDGPKAHDDYMNLDAHTRSVNGNIISNDEVGADIEGSIANILHDGMTYTIPEGGALILAGEYGKLELHSDGSYTYERTTNDSGIEYFQYTLQDADGDTDVAVLKFSTDLGCLQFGENHLQLTGTEGDDLIVGNGLDNVIESGYGEDLLYGGSGQDTFLFEQSSVDGNVDRIKDFNTGEGDVVDLSDFLQNYDPITEAIEDFIFQREVNGDTVISVDTSGSGNITNAVDLVVLENIQGEDLDQLVLNAQTI